MEPSVIAEFKTFYEFWPHYLGEHSHPDAPALHFTGATDHPVWWLRADLLMYAKWLSGGLDDELRRAGVEGDDEAFSDRV